MTPFSCWWRFGLVVVVLGTISSVSGVPSKEEHPYLLWTDRGNIHSVEIGTWVQQTVLRNLTNVVSLDFDYEQDLFFWTDVTKDQIFRAESIINNPATDKTVILSGDIQTPESIAVDWLYHHVYWVDSSADRIEVASYDGRMRKTLIREGLDYPRGLVVDPLQGWMYWTDWGEKPMISRCGLNGKHQSVIVDTDIEMPNGLTFDYDGQRLFWVDAKLDHIKSVDTNGGSEYTVLHDSQRLSHPFSITVLEDDLYWTDWKTKSINKVNKLSSDGFQQVSTSLQNPFSIRVYHESVQKNGTNRCGSNNGQCSDFCFPSPQGNGLPDDSDKTNGFTCGCRNNYKLDSDEKTCVAEIVKTDERPYLLLAERRTISLLEIGTWLGQAVDSDVNNVVSIDFDYEDGYIFWTDVFVNRIYRARKTPNSPLIEKMAVIAGNITQLEGIAVDWLYNHVYWVDGMANTIEVASFDGNRRRILVSKGLKNPRAIVVDPLNGWMYWTDPGTEATISRCGLNGKHQSVIVDENIVWPNGLTFDYDGQRLFWVDAKLNHIRSVDTNGGSGYTVLHDSQSISHPFSITVFEDDLYLTDWKTKSINKVNKITGDGFQQVFVGVQKPLRIRTYHGSVQKSGTNRCGTNNGQCSDFCFPSPQGNGLPDDSEKTNGFTCGCPNNYKLDSDQRTCVPEIDSTSNEDVSTTTTNTVSTATNTQTTPISDASTTVVPASTPATRSDIECLTNSISLHIPLGLLPTGQQVTWQDPSCVVADNGTHLVGTIGLGDCGTYVVFNSSHVTFENELVSSAGSTSTTTSGIDYGSESNSVIVVQCVYPRRETGSTAFRPVQGRVRFFEKTIGHMQVHMRQARDATFADIYPSQTEPREVHLNDKLYIKLTADQGSPVKVAINVDRCLATPSPSPLDTEYQELTNNGCPAIPSVSIHNSSSSEVHLSFRAFQFRSHPGAPVYVHCEVYVCPLSHPQCVAGCTNIAAARTRRAALSDVKSHLVSTGPFPVTNEKEQGAFGGQSIALIAVTGLCACLAVVATVFGILAWKGMRRQAKEIN